MSTQLAKIKEIIVLQDDTGRVYWTSGADVDADGSNGQNGNPFAYTAADTGLDYLQNTGYPHEDWPNVLIDVNGQPMNDGNGNFYSQTTYVWVDHPVPTRYVDASAVPYIVVNPFVRESARGVVIGCKARATYKGVTVDAVVADVSGGEDIGEMSIAAAKALSIPASPRDGGADADVAFEFWPGVPAVVDGVTYVLQPA